MPKERRTCQPRPCPYPSKIPSTLPPPPKSPPTKITKELDEVRCPICLDHPHNAVLLTCKSTTKGCHPYICDTSHRYSNCLDQFKKMSEHMCSRTGNLAYSCPLCRGEVSEVIVPNAAREYMNEKVRTCSKEGCPFSGTYKDLRKHVWKEHPMVCPTEPDPVRESEWRRLERRSDFGDLVSTMRSESEAGLTTSVVRIPSMSIVIIVRMNTTTTRVYTQSNQSETIVIDDDDDEGQEVVGEEEEEEEEDFDDNGDDDTEYEGEEEEEEEEEDDDECYVIGSRRR